MVQAGSSTQDLTGHNELLSDRVRAKVSEQELLQVASSGSNMQFDQQLDTLLQYGMQIVCSPDTRTHFTEFSIKIITDKSQLCTPDVYRLFVQQGNTDRNINVPCRLVKQEKKALM